MFCMFIYGMCVRMHVPCNRAMHHHCSPHTGQGSPSSPPSTRRWQPSSPPAGEGTSGATARVLRRPPCCEPEVHEARPQSSPPPHCDSGSSLSGRSGDRNHPSLPSVLHHQQEISVEKRKNVRCAHQWSFIRASHENNTRIIHKHTHARAHTHTHHTHTTYARMQTYTY